MLIHEIKETEQSYKSERPVRNVTIEEITKKGGH